MFVMKFMGIHDGYLNHVNSVLNIPRLVPVHSASFELFELYSDNSIDVMNYVKCMIPRLCELCSMLVHQLKGSQL